MRRRNKPKVVWLPPTNVNSIDTLGINGIQFASGTFDGSDPDGGATIELPVVQDGTQSDPEDPTSSLADIELSGYRLRRIVGKIWCFIGQPSSGGVGSFAAIYPVTAGLIVRRTVSQTGFSMASTINQNQVNVQRVDNWADPWIWRRTWLLGANGVGTAAPAAGSQDTPHQNFGPSYPGGNSEGPHVDVKTARIVGPEERLFLDVSVGVAIGGLADTVLVVMTDLRVLASMRANIGNRRNASR